MSGTREPNDNDGEEAAAVAFLEGQGGNSNPVGWLGDGSISGLPIASVNLPRAQSRTWLITLGNMRSSGVGTLGIVTAPPFAPNQTLDQLTYNGYDDFYFRGQTSPLKVRIQFGVGELSDRCLVDYPYGGGSFQVQGSQVRVDIPNTRPIAIPGSNMMIPVVGGFITAREEGSQAPQLRPPTYTMPSLFLAGTTGVLNVPVPDRAMAYKVWCGTVPQSSANIDVFQLRGDGTPIVHDTTQYSGLTFVGGGGAGANPPEWWWLHPQTQIIRLAQASTVGLNWIVQYLINLG
jgi:hypothetical protein